VLLDLPTPTGESESRIAELEQEVVALRRRDRDLTDFIENAAIGLHSVSEDGTVIWANQAVLDLLGYKKEEYVGHHIAEFHADEQVIQEVLERLQARETLHGFPARLRAKDGSIRHVLINSNVLWDGARFVHTRCISRDVTEMVQAEEILRNSYESLITAAQEARKREELFRAALQDSPIVVFHQSTDLRYTWVYNPFPEHAGTSLLGKLDVELFPADQAEQLTRIKQGVLSSAKGARQELALTTQAGLRTMDIRIEPFRDSSGHLAGILGTAVDITERKRNEQRLLESRCQLRNLASHLQVLREEERALTSYEVHDIGQRLTALDHELTVLAGRLAEGANPDVMVERLKAVAGSLGSTIQSSARISTNLRPSLLDNLGLAASLDWHAQEFASRTGIRVVSEGLEDLRPDPNVGIAVFRILQNTLANVERHSQASRVHIRLSRVEQSLILKISDNGVGITSEQVSNPASLGLLAMRELALVRGGTIDIRGIAGEGTTVFLEIPLDTPVPAVFWPDGDKVTGPGSRGPEQSCDR
jgi:PAS domain S-box-containing protein